MKLKLTFTGCIYIEGDSIGEIRDKFEEMQLWSKEALDCRADFSELLGITEADTHKDMSGEWDRDYEGFTFEILSDSEIDRLERAGNDDIEIILGQDHEYWLYSNAIDKYCGFTFETEEEAQECVNNYGYLSRDLEWSSDVEI